MLYINDPSTFNVSKSASVTTTSGLKSTSLGVRAASSVETSAKVKWG